MFETDGNSLDPKDWDDFRHQAHKMLDDMLDYSQNLRNQHVWQAMPPAVQNHLRALLPEHDLAQAHDFFMKYVLPYAVGNAHPRFMGWVHGGGTPIGMVAEMLAAGLNANVGGRNQAPVEIERQLTRWVIELFHFPETASGLFVTGTSMANLMGCLCARTQIIGSAVREKGLPSHLTLTAYTSTSAHVCIEQAMDICGLGSQSLRKISVNDAYQMDINLLAQRIAADKQSGKTPFLVVATVGSVDVGAIDNLNAIADLCQREEIWFHVDGAFGALAMLVPTLSPYLEGIERADSIAFDFHKWGQVPYDAGFILVRNGQIQERTFTSPASYLQRQTRGLSGNSPWPCDLGIDLSRSFRALKTWFTLSVYGKEKLANVILHTCTLANYLKSCIENHADQLELVAPVSLNIVCFRYLFDLKIINQLNTELILQLQESGYVAPSSIMLENKIAIRAAIVNHRTTHQDIDCLISFVLAFGKKLSVSVN